MQLLVNADYLGNYSVAVIDAGHTPSRQTNGGTRCFPRGGGATFISGGGGGGVVGLWCGGLAV